MKGELLVQMLIQEIEQNVPSLLVFLTVPMHERIVYGAMFYLP
jgi:hypothetical protein